MQRMYSFCPNPGPPAEGEAEWAMETHLRCPGEDKAPRGPWNCPENPRSTRSSACGYWNLGDMAHSWKSLKGLGDILLKRNLFDVV